MMNEGTAPDKKQIETLIDTALEQRSLAYAPYSGYRVGAALLASDGKIYTGCNIENAAYTPTICAERTAFFKAVSEGVRDFEAICIAGGSGETPAGYSAPCGVCRQVMREFCGDDFMIHMVTGTDSFESCTMADLLPHSFSATKHMA